MFSIFAGLAILCNLALMLTWIPASLAFHERYCHASCCCCLVRSPPQSQVSPHDFALKLFVPALYLPTERDHRGGGHCRVIRRLYRTLYLRKKVSPICFRVSKKGLCAVARFLLGLLLKCRAKPWLSPAKQTCLVVEVESGADFIISIF